MEENNSWNQISLNELPSEILLNIFSYLDYQDLVRCSCVSQRLNDLANHDTHWKGFCKKYWLTQEKLENCISWKDCFRAWYKDFGRYIHCYATIKSAWDKIEKFMKENCPTIFDSIKAGVSEQELDDAEKKLNVSLPKDLRCCYRIHNGQRLSSPGLMGSMSLPTHYRSESLLDIETATAGYQNREGLHGCMPLTFCLHSGLTQFIALQATDGHKVHTVFYPSQDLTENKQSRPIDSFISGRCFLEWFTSYADLLHKNDYVVLNHQPFRFFHEPGCEFTSGYITVSVATCFLPELSSVNPANFFHTYRITMSMREDTPSEESCQLETRHWIITDENGEEERVDGAGVVGEYPVMYPGAVFSWVSYTSFKTTYGNMRGHFVMRNLITCERSEVQCPVFHMKCLPYVTSAERAALKKELS